MVKPISELEPDSIRVGYPIATDRVTFWHLVLKSPRYGGNLIMNKETSLSSHQHNTLVRLAQGATLMVDSEDRIWIGQQRIFANTLFPLRTRKLIAPSDKTIVGQRVFGLSEKGRELLNGICVFRATPFKWVRAEIPPPGIERQSLAATEQGSGTKLGSPFEEPELASRSPQPDTDLSWFVWVFLAALVGLVVVFMTT